jgi:RNA polymerase sigma-70 factor (ECF subfamily)
VHEAIARARKLGRYQPLAGESAAAGAAATASGSPDPERQAFARELGALLEAAVDGLRDGCREVFVLRHMEEMTTTETAEVLGVSEEVVKTRLSRARSALRRDLLERAGLAGSNAFTFHRFRCDRVVAVVFEQIGA